MSDFARLRDGDLFSGSDTNQTNPASGLALPGASAKRSTLIENGSCDAMD
jgi:hypothetical protein